MTWLPPSWTHLIFLAGAGIFFHALLWARNGPFLWRNRHIILWTVALAEVWTLITDPIGGYWQAWIFDPEQVLGIWFLGVTPIEDFLGMAVVSSAAACAVLVFGYSSRRWL